MAVGRVGERLYSVILEFREGRTGEILHLVTLWKSTKEKSVCMKITRKPAKPVSADEIARLASFCRETLEMGVFQGVRAYAEALEWLSWLRSGTDQEGKKCRGG